MKGPELQVSALVDGCHIVPTKAVWNLLQQLLAAHPDDRALRGFFKAHSKAFALDWAGSGGQAVGEMGKGGGGGGAR